MKKVVSSLGLFGMMSFLSSCVMTGSVTQTHAGYAPASPSPTVTTTTRTYEVRPGMTRVEIERTFGAPEDRIFLDGYEVWTYSVLMPTGVVEVQTISFSDSGVFFYDDYWRDLRHYRRAERRYWRKLRRERRQALRDRYRTLRTRERRSDRDSGYVPSQPPSSGYARDRRDRREDRRDARKDRRETRKDRREEQKETRQDSREERREEFKGRREERRERRKERREEQN